MEKKTGYFQCIQGDSRACDSHLHVFDPVHYQYESHRKYTPNLATVEDLRQLHESLGVGRAVLVQPSVYGVSNECMLNAISFLGAKNAKGIAVVDLKDIDKQEIERLSRLGTVGIRLNLEVNNESSFQLAKAQIELSKRVLELAGWSLQIHASLDLLLGVADDLASLGLPVVLDHYAGAKPENLNNSQQCDGLEELLAHKNIYIKLSAPYRASKANQYADLKDLTCFIQSRAAERIVWGSDWPHTGGGSDQRKDSREIEPFRSINNEAILQQLFEWFPSSDDFYKLLVTNPERLYGFNQNN